MKSLLFDRRHLKEYFTYGTLAGILQVLPTLVYLHSASYQNSALPFIGVAIFMFVIMAYSLKLTRRRPEYKSTWLMIIAGHLTIAVGILVATLATFLLCLIYIPGFLSGDSVDTFIRGTPSEFNKNNTGTLLLLFITATGGNFGVGSFISILISYAAKFNQTKDKTPHEFQEPSPAPLK